MVTSPDIPWEVNFGLVLHDPLNLVDRVEVVGQGHRVQRRPALGREQCKSNIVFLENCRRVGIAVCIRRLKVKIPVE